MTRKRFLFTGFVLAWGIAAAGPIPSATQKPALYFPAKVGTKWEYEFDNGKRMTLTITKVQEKDGAKVVTVGEVGTGGGTTHYSTSRVSAEGLFLAEMGRGVGNVNPPLCELKLPHKDGGRWEAGPWDDGPYRDTKWKFTAYGPEEVKVPAGTFKAIRVESEKTFGLGPPRLYTSWYAPDVGMVKMVVHDDGITGGKLRDTITSLKSFTKSKD